jgi:hypothetical protein
LVRVESLVRGAITGSVDDETSRWLAGLENRTQPARSTRHNELAKTFPVHVVCAWIGNSRAVAQEDYLSRRSTIFS